MPRKQVQAPQESPARRLGILYAASFVTIAVLSGFAQTYILRELSLQRREARHVGHQIVRSLDRPVSLAVLAFLANDDPGERGRLVESLRQGVVVSRDESAGPIPIPASTGPESGSARLLRTAETHRLRTLEAAGTLLVHLERSESAPLRSEDVGSLLREIVTQEESWGRVLTEAAHTCEQEGDVRLGRLEASELKLLGVLLIVLVFEGLFVVIPAHRKMGQFMAVMRRSYEELKVYAKKLERSNKELEDFASVASHDLQEPLRKVQAFGDRLRSKYASAIDDQGRDYIDRIQNAAARMQTLINDLLTFARVTTKTKPFVPTDLGVVTQEVVSDLEVRIKEANGLVEVVDLPSVDADPLQMRQLLQNLIGNALKYKRTGVFPVVRVTAKTLFNDPSMPWVDPSRPACQIVVEDNGIGFDEIYSERIFTIFQRLHGRNEYEGTGIGLAVCRKIVERHGGTITAKSTLGEGSKFTVTLPIEQPKETALNGGEC
jgi:signal transduction histidine kinase